MGYATSDHLPSTAVLAVVTLLLAATLLPAPVAVAQADLQVIGGGPGSAAPGDTVGYSFAVTNLGPGPASSVTFFVRPEFAYDMIEYFAEPQRPLPTIGVVLPGGGVAPEGQPDCSDDLSDPTPWSFSPSQGTCSVSLELCDPESALWPALHVKCELGELQPGNAATVSVSFPLTMDPPPEADLVFSQPPGMGDWMLDNNDPTKGFHSSTFGASIYFDPASTGELTVVTDNTAQPQRGCGVWIGTYTGKVALIERGDCNFENKVMSAQLAGCVGAIIYNRYPFDDPTNGGYVNMAGDTLGPFITIPNVFIPQEAGGALKGALEASTVTLTMGPQYPLPWYQETLAFVYNNTNDMNPDNDAVLDVVEVGASLFADGLESGDTTRWSSTQP